MWVNAGTMVRSSAIESVGISQENLAEFPEFSARRNVPPTLTAKATVVLAIDVAATIISHQTLGWNHQHPRFDGTTAAEDPVTTLQGLQLEAEFPTDADALQPEIRDIGPSGRHCWTWHGQTGRR